MKYIIATLGCKVNQYETQAIESILAQRGHRPAATEERADAIIINTCAVTAESGRKSRQAIRHLQGEHPGAITAVCGCFSQIEPETVRQLGADVVFGSDKRKQLVDAIEAVWNDRSRRCLEIDQPRERKEFECLPAGAIAGRTRAMLKIQDGCDNFCSYCVIPYSRGRVRSLPMAEATAQAARLELEGYRELVITGIEIASYGKDLPGKPGLADVITAIAQAAPGLRIRLGSLEPTVVTEEFCRRMAALERVCDQFHLSLQSGCDRTLRVMRRKYDTAVFLQVARLLRQYFPDCALTADLIVGFPGETEADHQATLRFLEQVGFASMHIFPYSVRPGTRAAEMPGQLTHGEKAVRAKQAREVAKCSRGEYLRRCVGKILPVLFETERDGVCVGHGSNGVQVCVEGTQLRGFVKSVKIQEVQGEMLVGKVVAIRN